MNDLRKFITSSRWNDSAILFLRIFVGAMMLTHSISKVQNFNFMYETFPDILGIGRQNSLTAVALIETVCSCLILMGLMVRFASIILAMGMLAATFFIFPGQPFIQGELSFIYMGIYVTLSISGGGKYALDRFYARNKIKMKDII